MTILQRQKQNHVPYLTKKTEEAETQTDASNRSYGSSLKRDEANEQPRRAARLVGILGRERDQTHQASKEKVAG